MKTEKFLFLDIDGVLNSETGHLFLNETFEKEDYKNLMNRLNFIEEETKKIKFLRYSSKRKESNKSKEVDFGNFVETRLSIPLSKIIEKHNVKVIGISSWFVGCDEEELDLISSCLGFPIDNYLKGCGGNGENRLNSVVEFLENWKEKNQECNAICVYLDDDNFFNLSYEDRINVINFTKFNSIFNGLFVCPHGRCGINDNQFKQIDHWFNLKLEKNE